jgi:hypothetical protein
MLELLAFVCPRGKAIPDFHEAHSAPTTLVAPGEAPNLVPQRPGRSCHGGVFLRRTLFD